MDQAGAKRKYPVAYVSAFRGRSPRFVRLSELEIQAPKILVAGAMHGLMFECRCRAVPYERKLGLTAQSVPSRSPWVHLQFSLLKGALRVCEGPSWQLGGAAAMNIGRVCWTSFR